MTMTKLGVFVLSLPLLALPGGASVPALVLGGVSLVFDTGLAQAAGRAKQPSFAPEAAKSEKAEKPEKSEKADAPEKPELKTQQDDGSSGKSTIDKSTADKPTADKSTAETKEAGKSNQSDKSEQPGDAGKSNSSEGGRSTKKDGKATKNEEQDDKVPATVEEWLRGVIKPASQPTPAQPTPTSPTQHPVAKAAEVHAKPKDGKRSRASDVLSIPAFERPEMLAVNLSKAGEAKAAQLGFRITGKAGVTSLHLGVTKLMAPDGMSAEQARELLRAALPDQSVEFNQKYRIFRTATGASPAARAEVVREPVAMATPCGTDRCFGASIIRWNANLQECARSVRVGVIDTGYDPSHPTFRNKLIEPRSVTQPGRTKSPDWHGTGVLALLAGDQASGTPGLVPDAKMYLADIFYSDTDGAPASDTASLIEALDWLEKQHVAIINMSLTGPPDELLEQMIAGLSRKGIIFVAAVGNDGPSAPPSYPAAYEQVLAVTAVDKDLKSYRYATRGDHVDIAAPGVEIWTAMPNGQAGYHSGTSFAVPYVTAVLAAVYKNLAQKTKKDFLKYASVIDLGETGRDPIYGAGLLIAPLSCNELTATSKAPVLPAALISQTSNSR